MPYLYYDDDKRRWYMLRKKPKDVQALLGKTPFLHKFAQSVGQDAANAKSVEISRGWDDDIKGARAASDPVALAHWLIDREAATTSDTHSIVSRASALLGIEFGGVPLSDKSAATARSMINDEFDYRDAHIDRLAGLVSAILAKLTTPVPADKMSSLKERVIELCEGNAEPVNTSPSLKVAGCNTADTIEFWKIKRGDNQPDQEAINKRKSKMAKFLGWAGKPDDLTLVGWQDLQGYKEHLIRQHGRDSNLPRDHLIDVVACFNLADENHRFTGLPDGNPVSKLTIPPKRTGVPRPPFSDEVAAQIMRHAVQHTDPFIKYGVPLQAYHGAIISEFADAKARHVRLVSGIWCIEFTPEGRTTIVDGEMISRSLKTHCRHRALPLYPWFIRNGFIERVQHLLNTYGPDAPLFPEIRPNNRGERRTKASDVMVDWLRSIGIANQTDPETDKLMALYDSYNWRHWLATKLQTIAASATPERRRYLTGHAGVDVHENIYLAHPPEELKPYIDALPDLSI
jgi:hypothetical protein